MTWIEKDNTLCREIRTPDFLTAFNIVSRIVAPAEALNHHPDLSFGWGYVRIVLTTHDAGGITAKDRELAARIDEVVKPFAV
jgi:4a-hydroxytetrahydrobiopterin dehydratase